MMIEEYTTTGEKVYEVVSKMEPILEGVSRKLAIVACLSIAISLMDPQLEPEDIQIGVREASQYLCLFLDGRHTDKEGGRVVN